MRVAAVALVLPHFCYSEALTTSSDTSANSGSSQASSPPAAENKIAVEGKKDAARPKSSAFKTVVSGEDLTKYGDTSVVDVLRRQSEVEVVGDGRNASIRMNGMGRGYVQILIDGQPAPPGMVLDDINPALIERIEILRVPSVEYSTRGVAGTINIILKKSISTNERSVGLYIGRSDAYLRPTAMWQTGAGDSASGFSWLLSATGSSATYIGRYEATTYGTDAAGAFYDRQQTSYNRDDSRNGNINLRLSWKLTESDTIRLQSTALGNSYRGRGWVATNALQGALPPLSNYYEQHARHSATLRGTLTWEHRFGNGDKLEASLSGTHGQYGYSQDMQYPAGGLNPHLAGIGGQPGLHLFNGNDGNTEVLNSHGKYTVQIGDDHSVEAGYDVITTGQSQTLWQPPTSLLGPEQVSQVDTRSKSQSVFAQDNWTITPTWSAYLGVRGERLYQRSGGSESATASRVSQLWSPVFQTAWHFDRNDKDLLRLAFSRSFSPPAFQSQMAARSYANPNTQATPDFAGTPSLRPSLASSITLGIEHGGPDGLFLGASGFAKEITEIVQNVLSLDQNGRWLVTPQNIGKARAYGVTLQSKFGLASVVAGAPKVDLRASASANWSTVSGLPGPNNHLDGYSPWNVNIGADYRFNAFSKSMTVGGNFVYTRGATLMSSPTNTAIEPDRRRLDLYARLVLDKNTQLQLGINNALPRDTATTAIAQANGALSTTVSDFQQRSRVVFGVTVKY